MLLQTFIENFPVPIIAVDKNGHIAAKNLSAKTAFPVVHVGARASNYTDIDFDKEELDTCTFCGIEHTCFTLFHKCEEQEVTLAFLWCSVFGGKTLPFDIFELYKEKVQSIEPNDSLQSHRTYRKYVRAVQNNTIKANFFKGFAKLFDRDLFNQPQVYDTRTTKLESAFNAIQIASLNYLENIDIIFDINSKAGIYTQSTAVTHICERDIVNIMLNTLAFCIINTSLPIRISLAVYEGYSIIGFTYETPYDVDAFDEKNENSILNASMSLLIATRLATLNEITYTIRKKTSKKTYSMCIEYTIPTDVDKTYSVSCKDTIGEITYRYMLKIFHDL